MQIDKLSQSIQTKFRLPISSEVGLYKEYSNLNAQYLYNLAQKTNNLKERAYLYRKMGDYAIIDKRNSYKSYQKSINEPKTTRLYLFSRKESLSKLEYEDCDEFVYCIDTVTKEIVSWSKNDRDGVINVADDFYKHFIDNIENATEEEFLSQEAATILIFGTVLVLYFI